MREVIIVFVSPRWHVAINVHLLFLFQGHLILNLFFSNLIQDYSKDDDEQLRTAIENSKSQF